MSQSNDTQTTMNNQSDQAAVVAPVEVSKPARLTGDVTLTLQTTAAQKLFFGVKQNNKTSVNLLQFGGRMTDIWLAAKKDDPYADWFLVKVYDKVSTLRQQIAIAIKRYKAQLDEASELSRLNFTLFTSAQPTKQALRFGTQYGYLGASLVADYDELMQVILTARQVGILFDQPHHIIQQTWRQQLLSLFKLPYRWQAFGLTRQDVKEQTDKATKAKERMGKLPNGIQTMKLRSPFAPTIFIPRERIKPSIEEDKKSPIITVKSKKNLVQDKEEQAQTAGSLEPVNKDKINESVNKNENQNQDDSKEKEQQT